jgi:hypothetical protein
MKLGIGFFNKINDFTVSSYQTIHKFIDESNGIKYSKKILNFDSYIRYFISYNYALIPVMLYYGILNYIPNVIYFKMIGSMVANKFVILSKDEKAEISEIMETFKKNHPKVSKCLMYASICRKIARNYVFSTCRKITNLVISKIKIRPEAIMSSNHKYIIIPFTFKNLDYELFVPIQKETPLEDTFELYDSDENKVFRNHLQILPRFIGTNEYEKKLYRKVLNEDTWEYETKEISN